MKRATLLSSRKLELEAREAGSSRLEALSFLICLISPENTASLSVSQTSGRSPGRSPRRPAAAGARLALTYQGERLEENVRELSETLASPIVMPLDVTSDEQIADVAAAIDREFGGLDFLLHGAAFAPKAELDNPFVQTSREGFRIALDVSAYSLIALTRAVAPLMERRGGGSVVTLTYLGSQRVFTNYNVMGVAKAALEASVRYLAGDLGPKNIRVNAVSAGPVKTLAAMGIKDFSSIREVYRGRAPLRRNIERRRRSPTRPLFLSVPQSRGVTGEILFVDAGFHIVGI